MKEMASTQVLLNVNEHSKKEFTYEIHQWPCRENKRLSLMFLMPKFRGQEQGPSYHNMDVDI